MNKYISNTISNIALTGYKNILDRKAINLNKTVSHTIKGLALEMLLNKVMKKKDKYKEAKKTILIVGVAYLAINQVKNS